MSRVVVVGGGIAGLAAALRLQRLRPAAEIVLIESRRRIGGTILTEQIGDYVIEGGPDFSSPASRAASGCARTRPCDHLVERIATDTRTYVRLGGDLHPLPAGLTGMIPTCLDTLASSGHPLARRPGAVRRRGRPAGRPGRWRRVDRRVRLAPDGPGGVRTPRGTTDEQHLRGDGQQLSLDATFPHLRQLEREYGSVTRGLLARNDESPAAGPPFLSLRGGMGALVAALADRLRGVVVTGRTVVRLDRGRGGHGYQLGLADGDTLVADAVVLATPAYVTARLVASLDPALADAHAAIPYGSSALVTLAYPSRGPRASARRVRLRRPTRRGLRCSACTWTSGKWPARAPDGRALVRVYLGRFGRRNVTGDSDAELVAAARSEVSATLGPSVEPVLERVHRWPRGMPQYVLGSLDRLAVIERRLAGHPGLALAGAAYRGVGIPDCVASGEAAAESIMALDRTLEQAS